MGQTLRFAKTTMKDCPMTAITPDQIAFVNARPALASAIAGLIDSIGAPSDEVMSPARFGNVEATVGERVRELGRAAVAEALVSAAPTAPIVGWNGGFWQRQEPTRLDTRTTFGALVVERSLYRKIGVTNGPTIDPVSIRCGLVDGVTPACSSIVGAYVAALPTREAAQLLSEVGLGDLSRSKLERHAQTLGGMLESRREALENALVETYELPPGAMAVAVSVDRISVPMSEPKSRRPGRPRKHAAKNPVEVKYRLAYVGCWSIYDADGNALYTCRYGRLAGENAQQVLEEQLRYDIEQLTKANPQLLLVTLADGAPEMQNMLERIVADRNVAARLVDFWHAVEYLAPALAALGKDVERELPKLKHTLKSSDRGARKVRMLLATWALEMGVKLPEPVEDAVRYFTNQGELMGYKAARLQNLPIGSGHVEATAKTVVTVRMKRAGCRWKPESGQRVLTLRSLWCSSRWTAAMTWLGAERTAEHCVIREIA